MQSYFYFINFCVCIQVYTWKGEHVTVEDNSGGSVLSYHFVGFKDGMQIIMLVPACWDI